MVRRQSCRMAFLLSVLVTASAWGWQAREETSEAETQRQYLSGMHRDDAVEWDFMVTAGRRSGEWAKLPVPSQWDVKGFGRLSYFWDDPKGLPEQGLYRHRFQVPQAWREKRVFLVFEGVMTDTEARVNGEVAGPVHQGGYYRFKYDITKLVKFGEENQLDVTVAKHSRDPSINRAERMADYWLFGGIFRPVYLEAVPREYVDRVAIDARADGSFAVDVFTPELTGDEQVTVEVLDREGKVVGEAKGRSVAGRWERKRFNERELDPDPAGPRARLEMKVKNPALWTAETPNLYTARVRLRRGRQVVHEVTERFGFRTIEVRPKDGIYVNGRKVMFKGVNRHASHPDSGRCLSPEVDRGDILLMKRMNMNAVRMSHYPPDKSFLDLCDELGMYVIDELAGWQKSYDPEPAVRLVGEMVRRDVNHPCIVLWSNGNEGGWQTKADGEYAKWDPQRRNVIHPWALHENIQTKHYPSYAVLTMLLGEGEIVMPTELLHGRYDEGIGAGMRDFWDAIVSSPRGNGMFFWVFADEGVRKEDGSVDVAGNSAPDGILSPYRKPEASYETVRKIWSPVQLPEEYASALRVENRYDFVNLSRVGFKWELRRWRGPDERGSHEVVRSGKVVGPDVKPGEAGTLDLGLPEDVAADALAVTATDWTGRDLYTWVYELPQSRTLEPMKPSSVAGLGNVLRSGDVEIALDAERREIREIRKAGNVMPLGKGPRLALGAARPQREKGQPPAATQPISGALQEVKWEAGEEGWFKVTYTLEAEGYCDFLGVTFDLPEGEVKSARMLAKGPGRVWANRLEGPVMGVWDKVYNDTITGWSGWEYPEFKGYYAEVRWVKVELGGSSVLLVPGDRKSYVHLLTPKYPPEELLEETGVPFPEGGISVLTHIPAMGSNLNPVRELGPQSQAHRVSGKYTGSILLRIQ